MCRQFDSSQHHSNPLIISGFFVTDTLSDTLFKKPSTLSGETEIASTLRCKGDFWVTHLH